MLNNRIAEITDAGSGNDIQFEGELTQFGCIHVLGNNNRIIVKPSAKLGMRIELRGSNNLLLLDDNAQIADGYAMFVADNCTLSLGACTTIEHAEFFFHETGDITFGPDCMVSSRVYASVSDMHSILDEDGRRLNRAKSITVGRGVWVCRGVTLLKGADIGDGAIIGSGSTMGGRVEARTMVVGMPKRVLKRNVRWQRELVD